MYFVSVQTVTLNLFVPAAGLKLCFSCSCLFGCETLELSSLILKRHFFSLLCLLLLTSSLRTKLCNVFAYNSMTRVQDLDKISMFQSWHNVKKFTQELKTLFLGGFLRVVISGETEEYLTHRQTHDHRPPHPDFSPEHFLLVSTTLLQEGITHPSHPI